MSLHLANAVLALEQLHARAEHRAKVAEATIVMLTDELTKAAEEIIQLRRQLEKEERK